MERNKLMPYQKKVEIIIPIINHYCNGDDIVLDTFLGSGTSVIACEKTERICYGMEIEPTFFKGTRLP